MPVARPAPVPYHHGDLRAALVDGALQELRTRGADAVSLRSVAAGAGVSPSAAYHHFPDKTALLLAVGDRADAEFDAVMLAAWDAVPGDDADAALARFEALGRAYVGFALAEPHLFRHEFGPLCAAARAVGPAGPDGAHAAPEGSAFELLLRSLADLARHGLLRTGTTEGLDLLAWTTVHGFAVLATDGWMAPEAGDALFAALRRAVVATPGESGPRAG